MPDYKTIVENIAILIEIPEDEEIAFPIVAAYVRHSLGEQIYPDDADGWSKSSYENDLKAALTYIDQQRGGGNVR
jgi:hypothetical protein